MLLFHDYIVCWKEDRAFKTRLNSNFYKHTQFSASHDLSFFLYFRTHILEMMILEKWIKIIDFKCWLLMLCLSGLFYTRTLEQQSSLPSIPKMTWNMCGNLILCEAKLIAGLSTNLNISALHWDFSMTIGIIILTRRRLQDETLSHIDDND